MNEGTPNRWKGLVLGVVGGLIGAYAMQRYKNDLLPKLFPDVADPAKASPSSDPLEQRSPLGSLYQPGETAYQAAGRVAYQLLRGNAPREPRERQRLGDLAHWAVGLLLGVSYGATRTSTLPRDIAGGFFYGIRIWLGDEIVLPLVGLRAGPTRFSLRQHFALLTSYWVYSFITANATRLLYRLFSPEDW